MKVKFKFTMVLSLMLIAVTSCDGINPGPTVPACNWDAEEDISVQDIALKAPSGMSSFYYAGIPADRIMRDLQHPLNQGNFWSNRNLAQIKGNLKPDGTTCSGPQEPFDFKAGSSKIGGNYLRLPAPSNATFYGIVTMNIRSDDYKTTADPNNAEYVMWTGTGSDPNYPVVNGNILGSRVEYRPSTGKLPISGGGCYILNGQQICP